MTFAYFHFLLTSMHQGIQENMGKLDSRVTCLESEGLLHRLKPAFKIDPTSIAAAPKNESTSSPVEKATPAPFEDHELRDRERSRSRRHDPQYASRCTSTDPSPLEHSVNDSPRNGDADGDERSTVLTEQFRPREETPTKVGVIEWQIKVAENSWGANGLCHSVICWGRVILWGYFFTLFYR